MQPGDAHDARTFWRHMQRTTIEVEVSWNTFSASFETYMRTHYPDGVEEVPSATPVDMVLRYAFDRGSAVRAEAGERVKPMHLRLFLQRFGPIRSCLVKAARSLFDESGCLVQWFHGTKSRDEAAQALEGWEASHGRGMPRTGVFLFRYSDHQPDISFSYRRARNRMDRCLIKNVPGGYVLDDGNEVWRDLGQFVREHVRVFVHPVPSALYLECVQEIEARRIEEQRRRRTPSEEVADIRQLFDEAQTMLYSDQGPGLRELESALDMVEEVVSRLQRAELGELGVGELVLKAKALKLAGEILWNIGREEQSVARYLSYLEVVAAVQNHQDASQNESTTPVTPTMLIPVHRLLSDHYLEQGLQNQALHHFSELIACTTDHDGRQQLLELFQERAKFRRAIAGLTTASVEAMLEEGINHFRHKEFEPARNRFVQVLRDARCIGGSEMEARALGNLATVDYKTECYAPAIRKYVMCVQLLRQLGNEGTEKKILNYLVMCCIAAERWAPARRFLIQLSRLAESAENLETLGRLEARIKEGEVRTR
ncbi:unnamed protein product [Ascophyllum nodosum]